MTRADSLLAFMYGLRVDTVDHWQPYMYVLSSHYVQILYHVLMSHTRAQLSSMYALVTRDAMIRVPMHQPAHDPC
jgi:hypothetical protein